MNSHFPTGYARYRKGSSYQDYLNVSKLRHASWLSDALAVREGFCKSRPKVLLDACGDVCVVVLKMHLNNYISSATDAPWLALVTSEHTRAIIVEREGLQNYCSILSADRTHDWGHTPDAHNQTLRSGRPCHKTEESQRFVADVQALLFDTQLVATCQPLVARAPVCGVRGRPDSGCRAHAKVYWPAATPAQVAIDLCTAVVCGLPLAKLKKFLA